MVLGPGAEDSADSPVDVDVDLPSKQADGAIDKLEADNPFAENDADIELQRRYLIENLSSKWNIPLSGIAVGSAVGRSEAHLRIDCEPGRKRSFDKVIDDLQYPLRILDIKDITLIAPDHKVLEVNTVASDTLGYSMSRDLVMFEATKSWAPWLANGIANSAITHLNKCMLNSPLDPALVAYRLVFHKELGQDTNSDFTFLKQLANSIEETAPDSADLAKHLVKLPRCTAFGTATASRPCSDNMAQYIREHFNPDVLQTYLIKDVYEWSQEPEKARAALKEQPYQRERINQSLLLDGVTFALTAVMFASLFFAFDKKLFKLPDLETPIACPAPYGWVKPFLIILFTAIITTLGFFCAMAIAPEQLKEGSLMLTSYFKPIKSASLICFEEVNLTVPAIFAAFVLVGRKMDLADFLKLHFQTDRYSRKDMLTIGMQCFIVTFSTAMVATLLTYWFHFPWEKPGGASTQLLTSSGSIPAIFTLFLGYSVIAPIFEEMAFRGVLHPFLRRRLLFVPSLIIGATIFAVAHLEFTPWWLADKLVFAAVNAYALEKTNSIVPGIVNHILTNSFVLIFMLASMSW
jgi:membrane protease YdiL (CAAX protease family)